MNIQLFPRRQASRHVVLVLAQGRHQRSVLLVAGWVSFACTSATWGWLSAAVLSRLPATALLQSIALDGVVLLPHLGYGTHCCRSGGGSHPRDRRKSTVSP